MVGRRRESRFLRAKALRNDKGKGEVVIGEGGEVESRSQKAEGRR